MSSTVNICGGCGEEFECLKTGMVLHDERYGPASRFASDLFGCKRCRTFVIVRNLQPYFADHMINCWITNGVASYDLCFVERVLKINPEWESELQNLAIHGA